MPEKKLTEVPPRSTSAFLLRCAREPDRFYYPCNAKARDPVHCAYEFNVAKRQRSVSIVVRECEYVDGGTGWRAWPCALLLACWLAKHAHELELDDAAVLELGCGLGLPGLTAAALGARRVALSDCLPRLLRTVAESCAACAALQQRTEPQQTEQEQPSTPEQPPSPAAVAPAADAVLLDWDEEVPCCADSSEQYSTEQGVKAAQLLREEAEAEAGGGAPPVPRLRPDERFDLLLASDVIYSAGHAAVLPRVVARRAAAAAASAAATGSGDSRGGGGARFCGMVPVRCAEHTHAFLRGLQQQGFTVTLACVSAAWVAAVVALQGPPAGKQAPPPASATSLPCETRATVPYVHGDAAGATALREGDIVFVEACRGGIRPNGESVRGS